MWHIQGTVMKEGVQTFLGESLPYSSPSTFCSLTVTVMVKHFCIFFISIEKWYLCPHFLNLDRIMAMLANRI